MSGLSKLFIVIFGKYILIQKIEHKSVVTVTNVFSLLSKYIEICKKFRARAEETQARQERELAEFKEAEEYVRKQGRELQ